MIVLEPSLSVTISGCSLSITGVTVTGTSTVTFPPLPSSTVTVNVSSPLKPGSGVYVYSPVLGSIVTVPFLGCVVILYVN